jgi:hypothetical protein
MNQRLPNDICRCRDADCPEREHCLRWTQRDIGGSRLVSAPSCFPFETHSVVTDGCPAFIQDDVAAERAGAPGIVDDHTNA